ncbi:MAG: 50S ribosomal protein L9 [Nitrospinota bacterium]
MRVILNDFIPNLGSPGDEVEVKDGYARNSLIPKKLAVVASDGNLKTFENNRKHRARKLAQVLSEATDQKKLLEESVKELIFFQKAGETGKLFGSVTSIDIEAALTSKGFNIERKQITLAQPIKALGLFDVSIKLFQDVSAKIDIIVKSEDDQKSDSSNDDEVSEESPQEQPIEITEDDEPVDPDMIATQIEPD